MLRVEGLSKRYAGVTALSNVSLKIEAGEVHALCGEKTVRVSRR